MSKLDQEEREILEAFDAGELKQVEDAGLTQRRHKEYAEATSRKHDDRQE